MDRYKLSLIKAALTSNYEAEQKNIQSTDD